MERLLVYRCHRGYGEVRDNGVIKTKTERQSRHAMQHTPVLNCSRFFYVYIYEQDDHTPRCGS